MPQDLLKKFGQEVQRLRKQKGFSQESFAHEVGVHRTYMGFIERGERNPTLLNLYKISRALDLTLHELFGFDMEAKR
jgi:transcriptional regulator with XRE-family HTH domain